MKKSIFIAVLGMSACVVAYGQGKIDFSNYGGTSSPTVKYGAGTGAKQGQTIGSSFTAQLYYYVGTSALDVPTSYAQFTSSFATPLPAFGTTVNGSGADNAALSGWFEGGVVQVPGITAANAGFTSFYILASNGAGISGDSAIFSAPVSASASSGATTMAQAVTGWTVTTAVPEPTTLALAGLGGLASLIALRRKQA
jgi:hypothetical protein